MAQSTPTTGNITNIWIQDANGEFFLNVKASFIKY